MVGVEGGEGSEDAAMHSQAVAHGVVVAVSNERLREVVSVVNFGS